MFTLTKYIFLALLLMGAGWLSEIEFKEQQEAQKEYPIDKDNDGIHDYNCECGYCLEVIEGDSVVLQDNK